MQAQSEAGVGPSRGHELGPLKELRALRPVRLGVLGTLLVSALCVHLGRSIAQGATAPESIRHVQTERLDVYTDGEPDQVRAVLRRMERTLDFAMHYWHRPVYHRIQVYLVQDLQNWTPEMFPNRHAHDVLRHLGGGTEQLSLGGAVRPITTVYATNQLGIPEHELVHAYCIYSFGWCGPEWYREGMAERAYHGWQDSKVHCDHARITALRNGRPTIESIIGKPELMADSLKHLDQVASLPPATRPVNFEIESIEHLRRSYDSSWALCHFLCHHPQHRKGFHDYSCRCLRGEPANFWESLRDTNQAKLEFEFQQFLAHIEEGYDVAKCAWPWKAKFTKVTPAAPCEFHVDAQLGFQASGAEVEAGQFYRCECEGTWQLAASALAVGADGDASGVGRLTAVVYHDHQLSAPIPLGSDMVFQSPLAGKLYLRCEEPLHQLHDNSGKVRVKLQVAPHAATPTDTLPSQQK